VHVRGEFWEEGSFLRGTIAGGCSAIALRLELDSPTNDDVALTRLVENAERVCFVSQAVTNPVPVELSVLHNGHVLSSRESSR